MKKIYSLLAILMLLVFSACKKDKVPGPEIFPGTNEINTGSLDLGANVTADFFGKITDRYGQAVSGVNITVGNKSASTDADGIFYITDATVKENLAHIKAEKLGYFFGSRSLIPSTSAVNNVNIELMEIAFDGIVNSGEEATVTTNDGAAVDLKGHYVDENGTPYNGVVKVAIQYLAPKASTTPDRMPGMLYAENSSGQAGVLETYGMIAIELFGDVGQPLQIAQGSDAVIRMPVDQTQIGAAPDNMPLWYFDENAGYWVEEGIAKMIGNEWVGIVDHFSFWNCDVFGDDCQLNALVEDQNGNPLPGVYVTIITNNAQTTGLTNSVGEFFTYIPANESITYEIADVCGNSLLNQTLPPYSTGSLNSFTFVANVPSVNYVNIIGTAQNCSGQPVTSGHLELVLNGNSYFYPVSNGNINITFPDCNGVYTTVDAYLVDYGSFQQGAVANVQVVSGQADLGVIQTCNAGPSEYLSVTFDGVNHTWLAPIDFDEGYDSTYQVTYFSISTSDSLGTFSILSSAMNPGTHGLVANPILDVGMRFISNLYPQHISDSNPNVDCIFASYPAVGGYIELSMVGTYNPQGTQDYSIEVNLKAQRDS